MDRRLTNLERRVGTKRLPMSVKRNYFAATKSCPDQVRGFAFGSAILRL
jgi:hypothetical protein